MSSTDITDVALEGREKVADDWMPAAQVRSLVFEDPGVVWLQFHGERYGFTPDTSPCEFLNFIGDKGRQFEEKWVKEMVPDAVRVCQEAYEVRSAEKVRETFALIQQGTPIIAQPALWWAPARVYGVPDLLVHSSVVKDKFPGLLSQAEQESIAPNAASTGSPGSYLVFDLKFTTKLDEQRKYLDLNNYAAQVRIYTYMLGHSQGLMPQRAFLITRDRVFDPLPITIASTLNQPLDPDLASLRDHFVDIKINGANYLPWRDDRVALNLSHQDDRWRTAKNAIAREWVPGGDACLVSQIGTNAKLDLAALGFQSLESMLQVDPRTIPLEKCKGLGAVKSGQIRTILEANRSGNPVLPAPKSVPPKKQFEFYVDFEFFTNVNVDFERQWPTLDGCEMIFMIGVGWEDREDWAFKTFIARAEDQEQERVILEEFVDFLSASTDGSFINHEMTAIYHWTSAEVWQTRRASDRHRLPIDHLLQSLPWYDLQKVFLKGPCCLPGALSYGLKEEAKALGKLNPKYDPQWPGDLDEGLRAMVMGWRTYEKPAPIDSEEMSTLTRYLEADCKALWKILEWIRANVK
jgi:uncharacterized protein